MVTPVDDDEATYTICAENSMEAIQVASRGTQLGWLPDYLVDEVHGFRAAGRSVDAVVERANGPTAPSHVRLQCRLIVGPPIDDAGQHV